jgi:hypothetical protein
VPLVNPTTGLIDRAWYMFFLSLNDAATAVVDDGVGSSSESLIASYDELLRSVNQELQTLPPAIDYSEDIIKIRHESNLQPSDSVLLSQIAELQKQIDALQAQPLPDFAAISVAISSLSSAPVTYTADFSVAATDVWIINNKSGSSCTATLPAASSYSGRVLRFQNYQAQTLISASSNVVPLVGGAAGTAILAAVAGETCTLVSDGSNWLMTQYTPNNVLLLE